MKIDVKIVTLPWLAVEQPESMLSFSLGTDERIRISIGIVGCGIGYGPYTLAMYSGAEVGWLYQES